jgi:hypothetical protein
MLTILKANLATLVLHALLQTPLPAQPGNTLARVQAAAQPAVTDACPARNIYLHKTCRIKVDKLYMPAEGKPGYEILPLWEENQPGTVVRVECLPHVGIRVFLKLEDGREGYLEINHEEEIPRLLEQTDTAE